MEKTLEEQVEDLRKSLSEKENLIQTLTESYEEKLNQTEKKFNDRIEELNKQHTEEVRKIITGKRVATEKEVKKSFFDSAVEGTLKILSK